MRGVNAETAVGAAADAIRERLNPAIEAIEGNVHEVRQAVHTGRHCAQSLARDTATVIQRHPLRVTALALGGGAVMGCLLGIAIGQAGRR
jgi:hypothetical protein